LPEKPSIAVLPFINVGGDQRQEYFSDGITDDLITDLSKISGLFVIARNSVFTYKNKPMMVQCIAEQLGVRYLLEGSVRKAGDQIRINAQLIDATMGHHLWADRYDGNINDVFALQDKVTQKIVAALAVKLTEAEEEKVVRQETDNIKAYDFFLKGWEHYCQWTPEDFRDAIPYFERAIELDSHYGRAYAALASTYLETWQRQWDWPRVIGLSMDACFFEAGKYLQEAMKNPTSLAHRVASKRYIHLLYYEEAIDEARRAIAVDPNGANGYAAMAEALIYSGKPEEAVDFIKKAMRLDPHNLANHLYILGLAHFGMEQFQKAASSFERSFNLNPKMGSLERAYLAVAYLYLGQIEKAKAELDRPEIEDRGNYDLWVRNRARYKYPKDRARLLDGLSKVGME
jgi:TolB-like protein